MEFNCYDVLEVQGSRYIITEKIKYNEIIPKADQEQPIRLNHLCKSLLVIIGMNMA